MIDRVAIRRRNTIRPSLFRARALEAGRYVARHRGRASLGTLEVTARALGLGLVLGFGVLVAAQVVAGARATVGDMAGRLEQLMPNPILDRDAAPAGETTPNAAPILDSIDRVTKDSRLVVSGRVPSFAFSVGRAPRIEITVNSALAAVPAVDDAGRFSATVALANGENTIVVAAIRGSERVEAAPRSVTLDTTPPALAITKPAEGDSVDGTSVVVAGKTKPGASVTVNGHAATVTADGSFSDTVLAPAGPLTIDVVARDQAGNETKRTLRLTARTGQGGSMVVAVILDRATARPGERVTVDVLVTDQGRSAADATVSVTIGTASTASGRTDATGHFRASMVAPSNEGIVQVVAQANGQSGSGRGAVSLEVAR